MTSKTNRRWASFYLDELERTIDVHYSWEDGPEYKPSVISFEEIKMLKENRAIETWSASDMSDERYDSICRAIYRFEFMQVLIPKISEHGGYAGHAMVMEIHAFCPVCGVKRGKPEPGISWDGSRRLYVDTWTNDCGHLDTYAEVREEGRRLIEKTIS